MKSERYRRSTNIRYDFHDRSSTSGIIITNPIKGLLSSIHNALTIDNASKAISIIGPYGTGKSTGLLYALKYFTKTLPYDQQKQLLEFDSLDYPLGIVHDGIIEPVKKLIPCILVGRRRTISEVLSDQLYKIARELKLKPRQRDPIHILEKIIPIIMEKNNGLIIVIDELGKFLENAIDDPTQGDVYILQEIAELASRSNGSLLIITSRHQSFESYASNLSMAEINEWKKIQGRFYDIIFQSNAKESLQFVCESLAHIQITNSKRLQNYYWKFVKDNYSVPYNNFTKQNIIDSYPLHPVVTALLTPMFKKFAQNERSVFSFIHSNEEFGFKNFISKQESNAYCLSDLFDFVSINLSYAILNMNSASTWSQIETLLIKHPYMHDNKIRIFKTVCMLDLFRDILMIPPTIENITFCIRHNHLELNDEELLSSLKQLVKERILTKNETWESYHVWYGGTVDVEAKVNEQLRSNFELDEFAMTLNENIPQPPLLAKAHFARTGSIRYYVQEYVSANTNLSDRISKIEVSSKNPGLIFNICYYNDNEKDIVITSIEDYFSKHKYIVPVVLTFIRISPRIKKLFNYYRAVNTVKLDNDQIASDEVSYNIISKMVDKADNDLDHELRKLKSTMMPIVWDPINGNSSLENHKQLHRILSEIFDKLYNKTPIIFNEIANRSKPSASGNHGIKRLAISMLNYNCKNLGLSSGTEWGLYLSILKRTGIHQSNLDGFSFKFPNDKNLKSLWNQFDKILKNSLINRFELIELFNIMDKSPFGIKLGLQPILAIAFLQSHDGELSWYEDGDFIIDISPSIIEIFLKRPKSFSFRYIKSSAFTEEFYNKLISEFELIGMTPHLVTPIDILRPILLEVNRLPEYTRYTSIGLNNETRKIRNVILNAKEPERLIFVDIPKALNLPIYDDMNEKHRSILISGFKTSYLYLKTAYGELLSKLSIKLYHEFGIKITRNSRIDLKNKLQQNSARITDSRLTPFIGRILDSTLNEEHWIENIASSVIDSPPRFWKDRDVNQFDIELKLIVNRYFLFEKSLVQFEFQNSIDKILFSIDETERENHFDLNKIDSKKIDYVHNKLLNDTYFQELNSEEREYFISQLVNSILFKTTYE
jgi:hypothetical protein